MEKFREYDAANYINSKEDVLTSIEVAIEENDLDFLLSTLNALSRSKNFTQIARGLGITREGLYKALSVNGNPSFITIIKLLHVLGIGLKPYTLDQPASSHV
jgi:probable addiction module antidote protein